MGLNFFALLTKLQPYERLEAAFGSGLSAKALAAVGATNKLTSLVLL